MTHSSLEAAVVANHEIFMRTSDRIETVLAEHGLTHSTAQALCRSTRTSPRPP